MVTIWTNSVIRTERCVSRRNDSIISQPLKCTSILVRLLHQHHTAVTAIAPATALSGHSYDSYMRLMCHGAVRFKAIRSASVYRAIECNDNSPCGCLLLAISNGLSCEGVRTLGLCCWEHGLLDTLSVRLNRPMAVSRLTEGRKCESEIRLIGNDNEGIREFSCMLLQFASLRIE